MKKPIYLDYAATTPVDPLVAKKMMSCLTHDGIFGNPASRSHIYGWQAEEAVEEARDQVAELIGADTREIVWTSGATESDNLAIKGAAFAHSDKGRHIITSQIEHKAVLDCCKYLETQGFEVSYLKPNEFGEIAVELVEAAMRSDTILVSLMHVNNEIGAINDIDAIGKLCHSRHILFHVDAAQSAGKIPLDVAASHIDLLSLSAHKFYGPKGVGALYVRRTPQVKIEAIIHGGGHERGMRSGTLATHQITGMGLAAELAGKHLESESERILKLRNQLWQGIKNLPGVHLNGNLHHRVPGILNVAFSGLEGETLLMGLNELAISTGSACTSASVEPSFVLIAMGMDRELADASLRMSVGRFTTEEEIKYTIEFVNSTVQRLIETA